jgi:hypothetical protein
MKKRSLKIPFGSLDGRLVAPENVARGRDCNCLCPNCDWPLIANQGGQTRPYFSHDRGPECVGGFETAVHKMAKQIILDHLTVVLPAHSVEITLPVTSEDDVLTGSVLYPERLVQLVSAVSEKQAEEPGRWIPDVTATLKNNAKLYIEIKVTHGVEQPKAEALDNLMEIDLGDWEIDALADTEVLERAVLRMAARCWYRCSLYSNLKKVRQKQAELEAKVSEVLDRRRRREDKERDAAREHQRQREAARANYQEDLKKLIELNTVAGQEAREKLLAANSSKLLLDIPQRFPREFASGRWPKYLSVRVAGDWLFNIDRRVWQTYIYERAIADVQRGHQVSVKPLTDSIVRRFGVVDWAKRLSDLKLETLFATSNRKTPVAEKNVWFLTSEENALIRTPSSVVRSYLDALVAFGLLKRASPHTYQVEI